MGLKNSFETNERSKSGKESGYKPWRRSIYGSAMASPRDKVVQRSCEVAGSRSSLGAGPRVELRLRIIGPGTWM